MPTIIQNVLRTRRAFRNWLPICVVVGIAAPSSLPPRAGLPWLGARRRRFLTRRGTVLETAAGNGSPVIEVFAYGEYELPLDWTTVRRVLDVGAHIGSFALWVCEQAPAAQVVSIEPEPRNFSDLASNIARNGLSGRVEAVNAALGKTAGTVTLRVPMNRESASFHATDGVSVQATVSSLSDLFDRFDEPPDLVKLDCEGAEWAALDSLDAQTWAAIPRLVLECHAIPGRTIDEMADLLRLHGLEPTILSRGPAAVPWCDEVGMIWAERCPATP